MIITYPLKIVLKLVSAAASGAHRGHEISQSLRLCQSQKIFHFTGGEPDEMKGASSSPDKNIVHLKGKIFGFSLSK